MQRRAMGRSQSSGSGICCGCRSAQWIACSTRQAPSPKPTHDFQMNEARRCERRAPRSRRKMSSPAKVPEAKPTSNHPAEEAQWKHVRAHIAKGNKATEKAEQHYVAAAQYLKGLKVAHDARGGTWEQWEITVKAKA